MSHGDGRQRGTGARNMKAGGPEARPRSEADRYDFIGKQEEETMTKPDPASTKELSSTECWTVLYSSSNNNATKRTNSGNFMTFISPLLSPH
jgi:hypothetical protein